ncbi:MAG: sigma-54 dependent transcriptional regulator [Pirellulales bacterium]|nr:sigma-54 dependent transcriptional regulator [Pirellulales bacterium]
MGRPSATIFSKDATLCELLETRLGQESALHIVGSQAESSSSDFSATALANIGNSTWAQQTVFVDLRDLTTWSAEDWSLLQRRVETAHRVIGIVDHGIPLDRAVEADQICQAFLEYPFEQGRLQTVLREAERNTSPRRVLKARNVVGQKHSLTTYTPSLYPALDELEIAARHDFTILLIGETGTGKTYLANLIHELSPRNDRRFVHVACGALPKDLLDSELFGHKKGAFTGAEVDKQGKLEAAGDGTFLLDEIDVLGMEQQVKLLRILESGEYERVGCNETRDLKARTIVASNLSLERLISEGRFRSDLYFRLKQVKFEIPPLRQRPLDILPLAISFITECSRENEIPVSMVTPEFIQVLMTYDWPGNIRELRNETRRAVLFCQDGIITPDLMTPTVVQEARNRAEQMEFAASPTACLAREVATTEQEAIESMLKSLNFNRAATARALGISRVTLYNKIRKYRIPLDRRKPK